MRQSGFILPPLGIGVYGAIAAAVVFLGMSVIIKVQHERIASCKAQVAADKVLIQGLGDQITIQNEAILGWQNSAALAKAKGAKATAEAKKKAEKAQSEVNRLNGLLKAPKNDAKTCQDALRDVRKGLIP